VRCCAAFLIQSNNSTTPGWEIQPLAQIRNLFVRTNEIGQSRPSGTLESGAAAHALQDLADFQIAFL